VTVHSSPQNRPFGVLFVCRDNSRRSLIAEALMRDRRLPSSAVYSAGIDPADQADPFVLSALALADLGGGFWPKPWQGFFDANVPMIDTVVCFGDDAAKAMPRNLPGNPDVQVWRMPAAVHGDRHRGVWRDIQQIRPMIAGLVDDINAMQAFDIHRVTSLPAE
jgi:protein-tyrosine-phosphatase